ncbi:MAG: sugar phosphate isomerase/epimerase [Alphaproteobacteria bacterium]|nr:sugar phosphate isomerase/epimerase [Alphaproteobacteria bacterium]
MNRLLLAPTTLPAAEPLAFIDAAAAAGFDGIGLRLNASPGMPFHPVAGNAPLAREVKRRLASLGWKVHDILSFYLEAYTDVAQFAAPLELGAELGARYALTIGDDPDWSRMRDNFGRLCDRAAPLGISPSIEFVPRRLLRNLTQALRLLDEARRPNVSLCVDPLHVTRSGATADDLRRLDPRLIPYVQLCDGILEPGEPDPDGLGRTAPEQRCMPGEGVLPLRAILAAVPAGIPISVEVPFDEAAGHTPAQWTKLVAERTRRFLATS